MNIITVKIHSAGYLDSPESIKNIEFTIHRGELIGLIGANGAGKSTTIKAMMGLLPKFEGEINLHSIRYAYIPEHPVFYDELTLWEHLEFQAAIFQLRNWEMRAEKLLERFQLSHVKHDLLTSYSKGMRQKVMLVLAFMLKPDLYIVDEPFIGLDPRSTKEFLKLLLEEKNRGASIFMSTHVLDTAEKICDRILLMENGTIIASGTLQQLRDRCQLPNGSLLDCFDRILEEHVR